MPTITKPHTFTDGTTAEADEVNADFDTVYTWVNTQGIHKDGTNAFTAIPSGPASDPTTANQFTRKDYVDKFSGFGLALANGTDNNGGSFQAVTGWNVQGTTRHCTVQSGGIRFDRAGVWVVGGSMTWASNGSGSRHLKMQLNGSDFSNNYGDARPGVSTGGSGNGITLTTMIRPALNDVLSIQAFQNSGSNLTFGARLWAHMVVPI